VRSFFGLVNQACYAFSMRQITQTFRDLLKKDVKFDLMKFMIGCTMKKDVKDVKFDLKKFMIGCTMKK